MTIVLDASVGLSLIVPSQVTAASEAFRAKAADLDFIAPNLFALELRNALVKLERRGLVSPSALMSDLPALERNVVRIEVASPQWYEDAAGLARAEDLGFYDACYLDLALRRNAELASRDGALLNAAVRRNVTVHDLR